MDIGLFITLVPKVLFIPSSFDLTTALEIFIEFSFVGLFSVITFQPLIVRVVILSIIIGDVHQFVEHCPIHLDP